MTPAGKVACIVLAVFVAIPLILYFAGRRHRMTITAAEAQPGDVVLVPGDDVFAAGVYQAPPAGGGGAWSGFVPDMGGYGPPPQPKGELTLLVRNGERVEA